MLYQNRFQHIIKYMALAMHQKRHMPLWYTYDNGRNVAINIITSKTRVAPLKKQSIPRLELLGVTILARLMFTVQGLLKTTLSDPELYYWTDSFTTLCWIKHDRPWKQYVQHRVEEIPKLTEKSAWRFCPGKENPADIPSRFCNVQDLIDNALWWKGPSYLRGPSDSWPGLPTNLETQVAKEELKKVHHSSPMHLPTHQFVRMKP